MDSDNDDTDNNTDDDLDIKQRKRIKLLNFIIIIMKLVRLIFIENMYFCLFPLEREQTMSAQKLT